jgi:phage gp36-like protein
MAYSTLTDVKKLIPEETLIQLTDDEGAGIVNQARIDEAISQADEEIDSYLGNRYDVPIVAPVPGIIKKLSVDMGIYNLYSRRMEEIPKARDDRYRNAIRILEGIAKGTISVGETDEPEGGADQIEASTSEDDRIFTKDKLSGY